MKDDPLCNVCREPKSAHVATEKGPLTHPKEARGEGHYELQSYWEGFDFAQGDWRYDVNYRFVPTGET